MARQGRTSTGPEHIATVLDSLFKQEGLQEAIRVHRLLLDWDSIVGDAVARHTTAAYIEHGTLIVEVASSAWMHRLQMQESDLRTRVNRHLGEGVIQQVRFRIGSPSTPKTET